jgi:hypothetical protein
MATIPFDVADRIGPYYVYALIDPRDGQVFYVGKGTGNRVASHGRTAGLEKERGQTAKTARIHAIRDAGLEPMIDIVRHGITTEAEAFLIEAALIDCLPGLTNIASGHGSDTGRAPLDEMLSRYSSDPLASDVPAPALLIRLKTKWVPNVEPVEPGYLRTGAGWHPRISRTELYDAVRAWWKVSPTSVQGRRIRHAVAVVGGVTRGLYEIDQWIGPREDGRSAFTGTEIHEGPLHDAYIGSLGKRVPFTEHSQNPLRYWP